MIAVKPRSIYYANVPHSAVSGERLDRSTLGCLRAYVCEPCRTGPWECALSPELSESEPVCQQTHPAGSALRQAYHSPLIIAGAAALFIINVVPRLPIRSKGTRKEKHTVVLSQARSHTFLPSFISRTASENRRGWSSYAVC